MGILARRFAETRNDPGWLTRDDGVDVVGAGKTSAGIVVSRNLALSLTTVWRCVDLLSSAVSQAPKDVIVKVAGKSFPEFNKPTWLATPDPTRPNYTANDYFDQVAVSLLLDGNFFVLVTPDVPAVHAGIGPIQLQVLDPQRVDMRVAGGQILYDIKDTTGKVVLTVDAMRMLHGTWKVAPGSIRGISPLEVLKRQIGSGLAVEEHASRFFGQGAQLSFGVEYPGAMDAAKIEDLRSSLRAKYAGLGNAHAIGVLTNGAKFVSGLAPTPDQAQMLATRKFTVEDLARAFGVPPHMVGSQEPGASSYASADVNREVFVERSVIPLAVRIEKPHDRLLAVPDNLVSAPGVDAQFRFNLDGISRGNVLQRFQGYSFGVMAGVIKPNEAREKEDLPPDPLGDQLFMQSGTVPIASLMPAGAPAPAQTPQSEAPPL